jgi:hypothetical protein
MLTTQIPTAPPGGSGRPFSGIGPRDRLKTATAPARLEASAVANLPRETALREADVRDRRIPSSRPISALIAASRVRRSQSGRMLLLWRTFLQTLEGPPVTAGRREGATRTARGAFAMFAEAAARA